MLWSSACENIEGEDVNVHNGCNGAWTKTYQTRLKYKPCRVEGQFEYCAWHEDKFVA